MIVLIEIIGEDSAKFKNNQIPAQNKGLIDWDEPENLSGDTYEVTFRGVDVSGDEIEDTTTQGDIEGEINPTKVFWLIANTMKAVLCPECD